MANPQTPVFPYANPVDAVLTVASDNASTTLTSDISNVVTTIPVTSPSSFTVPCLLVIDGEIILANTIVSNSFTNCVRGFAGSTKAAHSNTTPVYGYVLAYHHNQLAAEITSLGNFLTSDKISGLRLHENLLSSSEAFENNTYWSLASDATISATTGTSPTGTTTARTLLEGTVTGLNSVSSLPNNLVIGTTYTFSVYAKYTNNQWLALGQNIASDATRFVSFDIQNGLIGHQGSGATGSIISMGNGWVRLIVELASTGATGKTLDIVLENADNSTSYLGTATQSAMIWGAQVHTGSLKGSAVSYIKTISTPVSFIRGGDLILDAGNIASGITLQHRKDTTSNTSSFIGAIGEITVDTTLNVPRVHDGTTSGGWPASPLVHTHPNATDSVAGFLSAADKTKLDSISGGTINYQTVQANGSDQTQREKLNFSSNFTITDDGAGNRTDIDLLSTGVSAGTFTKLTIDVKGRATVGAVLTAGDIPTIISTKISDFSTAVQTTRLDQLANPTTDVNLNSHKIINLADPVSSSDAATKNYVDNISVGLTFKEACRVASTGTNVNITSPGSSLDTVSLDNGDRVLLKDQTTASQNGIYIFNGASSTMTRSLDADMSGEVNSGMFVLITAGAVNQDIAYVLSTTGIITLGTTALSFVPFSAGGGTVLAGNGINVSGSTVSVKNVSSSRIVVGSPGVDLAVTGISAGTYNQVVVDIYGRITSASVQSYQTTNANLTGLTALSGTGILAKTGSGTFTTRAIQSGYGTLVTNGDGVANNPQINVVDDTSLQQTKFDLSGSLAGQRSELNFIPTGMATVTVVDNPSENRVDVTIGANDGSAGGDLSGTFPNPTVATVDGQTAANVAAASIAAQAATSSNTVSTIVKRNGSGNFSAGMITANLTGNVTGNCSGTAATFTGNLTGDVVSTGMVTTLSVSGVSAGTYGDAATTPQIVVDAKGRLVGVTNIPISPSGPVGGDLIGFYPSPLINTVSGQAASDVGAAAVAVLAATPTNTGSTLAERDSLGNCGFTGISLNVHTVSFSATPVFLLINGGVQKITLTNNVTSSTLSGIAAGQIIIFDIIQGSGSFTFTWPATVKGGGTIGNVSGGHNTQLFYSNGTNLYAVSTMQTDLS